MKIGLITFAYNAGGYTTKQLDSILPNSKHQIIPQLFLHNSRSEQLIEECEKLKEKYTNLIYYSFGINRGIAKSCNEGLYKSFNLDLCDITIIICQDVYFNTAHGFDDWIEKAMPLLDNTLYIGSKWCEEDTATSANLICTKLGWEVGGCVDENFFPAQYEEIDFQRRTKLLSGSLYNHRVDIFADQTHDSMLSRRKDISLFIQQTYITYPLCQAYYIKKWGGDIGKETFTHPFNDESIGYYIPFEKHSNPYGKYDRQDQGIVRI